MRNINNRLWNLLGIVYLPLVFLPFCLYAIVWQGPLASPEPVVRYLLISAALMLCGMTPASFYWPNSKQIWIYSAVGYSCFAAAYLVGNAAGVEGTAWYWLHSNLLAMLFFSFVALNHFEEDSPTRHERFGGPFYWAHWITAGIVIAGFALNFRRTTWQFFDYPIGIYLAICAMWISNHREQLGK